MSEGVSDDLASSGDSETTLEELLVEVDGSSEGSAVEGSAAGESPSGDGGDGPGDAPASAGTPTAPLSEEARAIRGLEVAQGALRRERRDLRQQLATANDQVSKVVAFLQRQAEEDAAAGLEMQKAQAPDRDEAPLDYLTHRLDEMEAKISSGSSQAQEQQATWVAHQQELSRQREAQSVRHQVMNWASQDYATAKADPQMPDLDGAVGKYVQIQKETIRSVDPLMSPDDVDAAAAAAVDDIVFRCSQNGQSAARAMYAVAMSAGFSPAPSGHQPPGKVANGVPIGADQQGAQRRVPSAAAVSVPSSATAAQVDRLDSESLDQLLEKAELKGKGLEDLMAEMGIGGGD